jgi:hypothetical protein
LNAEGIADPAFPGCNRIQGIEARILSPTFLAGGASSRVE